MDLHYVESWPHVPQSMTHNAVDRNKFIDCMDSLKIFYICEN